MIYCLKCGRSLESRFVSGGSASECTHCNLKYLSLAHLMASSDRKLVRELWEFVLDGDWQTGKPCPHCKRPLSLVPMVHLGTRDAILGCKSCYHLILKEETMAHFKEANPESKKRELLRQMEEARTPDSFQQFVNRIASATESKWMIEIKNEKGRQLGFAVSVGGILLATGALFFLNQSGKAMLPALFASACAFILGLRQVRKAPTEKAQKREKARIRDIGPQSHVPVTPQPSATVSSSNSRRWAA